MLEIQREIIDGMQEKIADIARCLCRKNSKGSNSRIIFIGRINFDLILCVKSLIEVSDRSQNFREIFIYSFKTLSLNSQNNIYVRLAKLGIKNRFRSLEDIEKKVSDIFDDYPGMDNFLYTLTGSFDALVSKLHEGCNFLAFEKYAIEIVFFLKNISKDGKQDFLVYLLRTCSDAKLSKNARYEFFCSLKTKFEKSHEKMSISWTKNLLSDFNLVDFTYLKRDPFRILSEISTVTPKQKQIQKVLRNFLSFVSDGTYHYFYQNYRGKYISSFLSVSKKFILVLKRQNTETHLQLLSCGKILLPLGVKSSDQSSNFSQRIESHMIYPENFRRLYCEAFKTHETEFRHPIHLFYEKFDQFCYKMKLEFEFLESELGSTMNYDRSLEKIINQKLSILSVNIHEQTCEDTYEDLFC